MIQFITLNTIVTDLINVIRGSKISQSETINRRQVEDWVNQYRALLLKQDLDKGKMPNPDYIQEIKSVILEVVDRSDDADLASGTYFLRTAADLPTTIDLNFKPGITYIGTIDGKEIQLVPEGRAMWQRYKRFTANDTIAFLRNKRIHIETVKPIKYIDIRGIFEIPIEASNFINTHSTQGYTDLDDRYPIPVNLVPVLKEMILSKELGITTQAPSDNKNDSTNKVSLNAEPNYVPQG